jgi:MFS family permease
LSHAWRALRHRNFQLFFVGQGISQIGNWMTRLATTWLMYRLTRSALMLGALGFAGQIILFLLAPVAGVWVERWDRRKLLIWTQAAGMVQSALLALLTLTNTITVWEVLVLAALQGLINAFDMPGRQSFLIRMVDDRADLGNAIAINSSMGNGARLIGPAIAGILVAAVGEGWCFFIDAVSYIAVIASLMMMRLHVPDVGRKRAGVWAEMHEGWQYVTTFLPVRTILTVVALISLLGYSYSVVLPIIASEVLHGTARTLGWLAGAAGVGALCSALSLTLRRTVVGLTKMLQIAPAMGGCALALLGMSHVEWVSILLMVFVGFGVIQTVSASNTIIQSLVPEEKRARTMSWYNMAHQGVTPFGSLIVGSMAHGIGVPYTVAVMGVCCVAGVAWFTALLPRVRAAMRPVYEAAGLIPARAR